MITGHLNANIAIKSRFEAISIFIMSFDIVWYVKHLSELNWRPVFHSIWDDFAQSVGSLISPSRICFSIAYICGMCLLPPQNLSQPAAFFTSVHIQIISLCQFGLQFHPVQRNTSAVVFKMGIGFGQRETRRRCRIFYFELRHQHFILLPKHTYSAPELLGKFFSRSDTFEHCW